MPSQHNFVAIEIPSTEFQINKSIIISIVYRPPDTSIPEFIDYYQAILSKIQA